MDSITEDAACRPVTLQDIAERCGVTKGTVSRALNFRPRIGATTAAYIRAVAAEMGYNPANNEGARRLSLMKSGTRVINRVIALFSPSFGYFSGYFGPIFSRLTAELAEQDFALLTMTYQDNISSAYELPLVFDRGDVDGAILFGRAWPQFEVLAKLQQNPGFANRPILSLMELLPENSCVRANEAEGAVQATRYLLELGHHHILHFIYKQLWPGQTAPEQRTVAVRQTMEAYGLDPDTHLHFYEIPDGWDDPNRILEQQRTGDLITSRTISEEEHALQMYLRAHPDITAILAVNDTNAVNTIFALRKAGYQIPQDYSVVGFDDTDPFLDATGKNILTSVLLPFSNIGAAAANTIVRKIETGETAPEEIILPTKLVIRGSTGPCPS